MTTLTTTDAHGAAAPAAAAHAVRPFAGARHALALAGRALLRIRRNPEQFTDVTLQPLIFLVMFVYLFGGAIAGGQHQYLQFVLPGLMVQNVLFTTISIGVNLNADVRKGVFDRFRSLPIARSAPLVGAVIAEVVRYTASVVVLVVAGLAMGFRFEGGVVRGLAAGLLAVGFAMCACWMSVFVGMAVRSEGSVQGLGFMVLFPLTFASTTFVRPETLPGWLQAWVRVNPVTHVVDAVRALMLGGPVAGPLTWSLFWSAALLAVFAPLAVRAYRRRS
jgi:oleandomycin transport system permease protein